MKKIIVIIMCAFMVAGCGEAERFIVYDVQGCAYSVYADSLAQNDIHGHRMPTQDKETCLKNPIGVRIH